MRTGVHIRKAEVGETEAQRDPLPWRLLVRAVAVVVFVGLLAVLFVSWMGSRELGSRGLARRKRRRFTEFDGRLEFARRGLRQYRLSGQGRSGRGRGADGRSGDEHVADHRGAEDRGSDGADSDDPPATAAPVSAGPTVLPGGSPPPVLIVFDGASITVSGAVRSAAAASRLSTLAEAYSKTPNAQGSSTTSSSILARPTRSGSA